MVASVRDQIESNDRPGRFDQLALTQSFLVESLDKICLDMLWFDSVFDVLEKQRLRKASTKMFEYFVSFINLINFLHALILDNIFIGRLLGTFISTVYLGIHGVDIFRTN